jgi:hypothetical protein
LAWKLSQGLWLIAEFGRKVVRRKRASHPGRWGQCSLGSMELSSLNAVKVLVILFFPVMSMAEKARDLICRERKSYTL